ncbi:Ras-like protein [Hapsidospora chrysogenum ATCC 11550]|uniref:Ras-like protein n=1 Tax=Hapsidospora chrysogenum (strain ATCC 11550 / CBS 779.69 / DSM 880 / IAM 14645 / JCM 23072 / IMI 49137) TaxID=857340 RepID=A0A086SXE2_HAPC1|nr:Ras-like protein [Hapsidospora chrysogenum ATCC 11550]
MWAVEIYYSSFWRYMKHAYHGRDFVRSDDGFLLAYSVSCRQTFSGIKRIHQEIQDIRDAAPVPILLVGTKCDLPLDLREVSFQEGAALARELGCGFMETSAKDDTNVDEAFHYLVRAIRDPPPVEPPTNEEDPGSRAGGKESRGRDWKKRLSRVVSFASK